MKQSFATALLIGAAAAEAVDADLNLPSFSNQVQSFSYQPDEQLFGSDTFQLQIAKTANMLIATEALRLATANLQQRVEYARAQCEQNASEISENASDISDNEKQIHENAERLRASEIRLVALDEGYDELEARKYIDRQVIIKMCHQYAYASTLVDECYPILES